MRFFLSLLLLVCLLALLAASVESKSSRSKSGPSKSGSKSGPSKSGSKGKHDRKTPGHRHGHRRHGDDSSSEEEVSHHKRKKDHHERRNHTFLDAEREFSAHSMAVHGPEFGNYKLRNASRNEIITHDKKRNFTLTSHQISRNSSGVHFEPSKNVTSSYPGFSNTSNLFNNSYQIPKNSSHLYGWSVANTSHQANISYLHPNLSKLDKIPLKNNSSKPLDGWSLRNSPYNANETYRPPMFSNGSRLFDKFYANQPNIMNTNSSKPLFGWSVSNSSQQDNYRNFSSGHSGHSVGNILNKNSTKPAYGWKGLDPLEAGRKRGFDEGYIKQFVDSSGNMLPISRSYDRAPSAPLPDPHSRTMTQTFPSIGWNINQNQLVNAETNRQSVSHLFVPPPPMGWIHNPAYTQPQFNHYGNYDPGFVHFDKKKDKKKKKKKFKLDLSLEDFSLEDLSLEDINWSEIFKGVGENKHNRLKKLLQAKIIEKLPTRRLYAAKFPAINQGLILEETSSKLLPNLASNSFTGYFNSPSSPKVFAGLESTKVGEVLLRKKRDLSPEGQAMANAINKFLLHERDCNETLEARRKRDVEGLIIKKKPITDTQKQNTSRKTVISNFGFDDVEAVVQNEINIEIFASIPQILALEHNSDEKHNTKFNAHGHLSKDSRLNLENNNYKPEIKETSVTQPKQQSQTVTTEKNSNESKSENSSTESSQQGIANVSEKDLNDGMTPPTLGSGDKDSKNITRLSRVHQTLSDFLGKRPSRLPTKLHPVKESLDSWRKSFIKKIKEENSESIRSGTQTYESTTEHVHRRSTRSLLGFEREADSSQKNGYNVSNSELVFQYTVPTQNTRIFLYNHSTASNNGQPYVYSKQIDQESFGNGNGVNSSSYRQNAYNSDFRRSSTIKDDQKNTERINPLPMVSHPLLETTIQSLDRNDGSKTAGSIPEKYDYTTVKLSEEIPNHSSKQSFIHDSQTEVNIGRRAKEENPLDLITSVKFNDMWKNWSKVYFPISSSPSNGRFTERIEEQSHGTTPQASAGKMQVVTNTASHITGKQIDSSETNTARSGPIPHSFIYSLEPSQNKKSTVSSSSDVSIGDSYDEEYTEENTTLPNEPKADESTIGYKHSSIFIHRVQQTHRNPNSKRIYHFYHGIVTPSIRTVANRAGEAIIIAPKKKLYCPQGQRVIRGRCKVIWR